MPFDSGDAPRGLAPPRDQALHDSPLEGFFRDLRRVLEDLDQPRVFVRSPQKRDASHPPTEDLIGATVQLMAARLGALNPKQAAT
jgi:hypothetical protein